jgi:hypothetical protein
MADKLTLYKRTTAVKSKVKTRWPNSRKNRQVWQNLLQKAAQKDCSALMMINEHSYTGWRAR